MNCILDEHNLGNTAHIHPYQRVNFVCRLMKNDNPETSLEKIKALTCNEYYAPTTSTEIQLKICHKK